MKYLIVYLALAILSVLVYFVFYRDEKKMAKNLLKQLDKLLFSYDYTIYSRKNAIFDYDNTKSILFHNQKKFFSKPEEYLTFLPELIKDTQYLSDLVNQEILSKKDAEMLVEAYGVWEKMHKIKENTYIISSILTLWIGKLLLPR